MFFKISIKDRDKNKIGYTSIYSNPPKIFKYIKENITFFLLSISIHFFSFCFILKNLYNPGNSKRNGEKNERKYGLSFMERNPSSVFLISKGLKVEKVLSLETVKTFGRNIENEDVLSLLSSELTVDSPFYKVLSTSWSLAFSEGENQFNLIKDQLPKKNTIYLGNKLKTFQASYKAICGKQGEVKNIICNLNDITEMDKRLNDYKKGYVENIMVQEILEKENKKEISQNLERSLRLALNELEFQLSRYDELNKGKELIKSLNDFLSKIKKSILH